MRLLLYKHAYRTTDRGMSDPFVELDQMNLVEACTMATMHAGTAQVEGRKLTAAVFDDHEAVRFAVTSFGDGTTRLFFTDDTASVLDEHWPEWRGEDNE